MGWFSWSKSRRNAPPKPSLQLRFVGRFEKTMLWAAPPSPLGVPQIGRIRRGRQVRVAAKFGRAVEHAHLAAHQQPPHLVRPHRKKDFANRVRDQANLRRPGRFAKAFRSPATVPRATGGTVPPTRRPPNTPARSWINEGFIQRAGVGTVFLRQPQGDEHPTIKPYRRVNSDRLPASVRLVQWTFFWRLKSRKEGAERAACF